MMIMIMIMNGEMSWFFMIISLLIGQLFMKLRFKYWKTNNLYKETSNQ